MTHYTLALLLLPLLGLFLALYFRERKVAGWMVVILVIQVAVVTIGRMYGTS